MKSLTIHASVVIIGSYAVLIRGNSGDGKSMLGHGLLHKATQYGFAHSCWLADDRVCVKNVRGKLIANAPNAIFQKAELYGLGILSVPAMLRAIIVLVVEIDSVTPIQRMPEQTACFATIEGVKIPSLKIPSLKIDTVDMITVHKIMSAYVNILHQNWPLC